SSTDHGTRQVPSAKIDTKVEPQTSLTLFNMIVR
ncbi:hypothetical protein TcasGA2_TC034932, partial [Tribolium castaneum]